MNDNQNEMMNENEEVDSETLMIENIKTTMAIENHILKDDEIDMLRKCYNDTAKVNEVIKSIKEEINSRMV